MTLPKYGIIGNPVKNSLSPVIHRAFMEQTQQFFEYVVLETTEDRFISVVRQFQQEGGKGLNVTLPFKLLAYQISQGHSPAAQGAKAASALQLRAENFIYAANYDGLGLCQDLVHNRGIKLQRQRLLILGAGGAARGILAPLLANDPRQLVIANRTRAKAVKLAQEFIHPTCEVIGIGFDDCLMNVPYDVVIHATSVGQNNIFPDWPQGFIGSETICYDLSYGKAANTFLQFAREQGAKQCYDGWGMLVEHNAAVFKLWFDVYPNSKALLHRPPISRSLISV